MIKEWLDSLYQDEYLFTDEYNEFEISHQFEDHRHDQSMFSVLRKIRGCTILPDDTFAFDWSTVQDVPFLTTRIRE